MAYILPKAYMIDIQKSEMLLQIGKTNKQFFFFFK